MVKNNPMDISQPLSLLITEVCARAEQLLASDVKIAQYRFGFYRIPFSSNNSEEGLALQIWLRELPSEQFPHRHNFRLRSRLLKGSLTRHLWEVKTDLNGSHRTIGSVRDESTWRDIEVSERVSVRCTESKKFKAGDIYEIPFAQIHSTTINSFPTVTIVDKRGFREDAPPVHYAPLESKRTTDIESTLFESDDNETARKAIVSVLKELSPAAHLI
jgi:hypothetical protein